jgi:crotonobetainyl-CoA:carnitine CoA-transferase CaiB-like acyl-CoA transferase
MQTVLDAIADPQARAMGYVRTLDHESGPIETIGPPFRIEGTPLGVGRAASPVNADARAVLAEVGLGEAEIEELLPDA